VAGLCRVPGQTGACTGGGDTVTLRQTADDKVERSLEFGCTNGDGTTAEGSWYRVFSLEEAGITGAFEVERVSVGICFAVGDPEIEVSIGTTATATAVGQVTPIRSTTVTVEATQISKVIEVPLAATVPAGANLVVEIALPELDGTGQQVNAGFTAAGEQRPGFLRSPLCGPASPMTTTAAGIPDAHLVVTVTGTR
jgi:hypothetical protein